MAGADEERRLGWMNEPLNTGLARLTSIPATPHAYAVRWLRLGAVLVFVSLILEHGFDLGEVPNSLLNWADVLLAAFFTSDLIGAWWLSKHRPRVFAARRPEYYLLAALVLLLLTHWFLLPAASQRLVAFFHLRSAAELSFNLVKLFLLFSLCIQLLRGTQRLFDKGVRPELILGGSFAVLIGIGSLLLVLPNSGAEGRAPIRMIDALFTATSATCVTGLSVRDTGTDFSGFGQMVILALFQVGGLGIVTFIAFLSAFSTRTLPVPQMVAFRQIVNAPALSDLKRQIAGIFIVTGVVEVLGAILIFQFLPSETDPLSRVKWSVFHSVSAFCNAGFGLESDSLESLRSNVGLNFTIMGLVVLGGLGFLTISEILRYRITRGTAFRKFAFFRRLHAGQVPVRLSVQAKLSITATAVLLIAGFAGFWLLEANHMLKHFSPGESFLASAFQSVTPRTAGFNTVSIGQLQDATIILLMLLMVIGANPVSAGGGIKTVSFAVLLLALRAMVTRRDRVEAFGRTLPSKTLFTALSVFVLYVLCATTGLFLLSIFDPQTPFLARTFEVISALSTVGLSMGITADLSPAGKLVLCLLMFIGRVGPISLVLSVFQSQHTVAYEFPEEEVVVG